MSAFKFFGYSENGNPLLLDFATGYIWVVHRRLDGEVTYQYRDSTSFRPYLCGVPEDLVFYGDLRGLYNSKNGRPTWTRLRIRDVLPATLDHYHLPWEYEEVHMIIILPFCCLLLDTAKHC